MTEPVDRCAVLWVTAGSRACCIPLVHVMETMRPLPVIAVAGAPSFVAGLSVIRGAPVPVVDLAAAMGVRDAGLASRCVVLRVARRRVALHVTAVTGVKYVDHAGFEELPPLLQDAGSEIFASIGALDTELLVVLQATRILTEETWTTLLIAEPAV